MADVTLEVGDGFEFISSAFSPTAINDLAAGLSPTTVDLSLGLTGGIADDAAMNSDQWDNLANRGPRLTLWAAVEWFAAATTGQRLDFYVGWSPNSIVTDGNPAYLDGVDGDYDGGVATLDEGLDQLEFIGSLTASADIAVQIQRIGTLVPKARFGHLVVVNRSGAVICGTDDIETNLLMQLITDDIAA